MAEHGLPGCDKAQTARRRDRELTGFADAKRARQVYTRHCPSAGHLTSVGMPLQAEPLQHLRVLMAGRREACHQVSDVCERG